MVDIEEYMKKPLLERQMHIRLDEPCIERGLSNPSNTSTHCKGLLAHIFDTTIPKSRDIQVCHACNNEMCASPGHLYWGSLKENRRDRVNAGNDSSVWEYTVRKHGLEKAREMNARGDKASGGRANVGKAKSPEHRAKISASCTGKKRGPYKKRV